MPWITSFIGEIVQRIWRPWILLLFATMASTAAEARCKFAYTEDVQRRIVVPEIDRRVRTGNSSDFDLARPGIIVRGDRVELTFSMVRRDLLDPPDFDVLLLECGRRLGGSRLLWWPGTGVTGAWIPPNEQWPSDEGDRTSPTRQPSKVN